MQKKAEKGIWSLTLGQLQIPCPRFIGREQELLWLQERLGEARQGRGDLVLLAGEAGIGKSRLLTELTVRGQQSEIRILEGKCSLFEAALSYAPFVEAFRGLLHGRTPSEIAGLLGPYAAEVMRLLPELVQLLPGIRPNPSLSPPEEKSRLFESLYQVLHRISLNAPLILALEDVHWADLSSLEFLHFLARRLRRDRWLVLVTYRPEELTHAEGLNRLRQDLFRERLAQELILKPLDSADAGEFLREVLGDGPRAPDALAAWIFQYGEGNPFFTEEILRAIVDASDEPIITLDPTALSTITIPATIQDAILMRLRQLAPDVRGILAAAAVLGRTFDLATLQDVIGLAGDAFTDPFMSLLSLQLIRTERTPMRYGFRHHLIREVVLQNLAPDLRRRLHQRVGELLAEHVELGAGPQVLTHHFREAGDRDRTLRYSLAAGAEASAVYAHDEAARYFSLALDMLPASATHERLGVAEALGDALFHAGHRQRGAEAFAIMCRCAEALGGRKELARAYRKLGQAQNEQTEGTGLPAWEKGLAILAEVDDPSEEAMIREQVACCALKMGQIERWVHEGQAALTAAIRTNDPAAQSRAYTSVGINFAMQGSTAEAREALQRAVVLAQQSNDLDAELKALNNLGAVAFVDGEFGKARTILEKACNLLPKVGEIPTLLMSLGALAEVSVVEGRWDEAESLLKKSTSLLSSGHRYHWPFAWDATRLAHLQILRGRLDEAEALLREARTAAEVSSDSRSLAIVLNVLAMLELRRGDPPAAKAILEQALAISEVRGLKAKNLFVLSEVTLQLGHLAEARALAENSATAAAPFRYLAPRVLHIRGQVDAQAGDLDEAVAHYQAALEMLTAAPQPYQEALLRYHLGLCLLRRSKPGDRKAGRVHLAEACALLDRLGAQPDYERTRQALHRIGGRTPAGHALTAREREVLALLTEGLSNAAIAARLYISQRTVGVHVGRILDKLGVENRIQAATTATRHAAL